nr:tetraspanin-7 [Columba livia]
MEESGPVAGKYVMETLQISDQVVMDCDFNFPSFCHSENGSVHPGTTPWRLAGGRRAVDLSVAGQITGVILLAVGVWGKLTLGTYISLIAENSTNAPYVLIGTGTTIIVFGLFGCFATCRGSPWMLKLYAMFLSLVFLAELVAGISGFVFRHEIKDTFLRTYTEAIQNYNKNDERSHAVDNVQESLSCCGIQSYTNWSTSPYFFKHGIPTSCCMNSSDCNTQDLRNMTVAATKVNQKGCYDLVTSFMETNMGIIAGVAFGIAFSQLIGMLLACCLSRFITANQYEMV